MSRNHHRSRVRPNPSFLYASRPVRLTLDPPPASALSRVLLALMKENVKLNELDNVKAAVLDWGEDALPVGIPPKQDILLLADCVYFEPAFPLLGTSCLFFKSA